MAENQVDRVRYQEHQYLSASDLTAEQAYRLAMRRRHQIAHHRWGIVSGLELTCIEEDGRQVYYVKPGIAIDGYGRELIVPELMPLPAETSQQLQSNSIDVWLLYGRVANTPPQRGRWVCGPGQHSRWREEAHLRLRSAGVFDSRQPFEVPTADLDFGPERTPPDDPAREWPVYLGRLHADTAPELAYRPVVELVGESITAASGRARMQLGSQTTSGGARFAVALPESAEGTGEPAWVERLAIGPTEQRGETTVTYETTLRGDATVAGDLILAQPDASSTEPVYALAFEALPTPPEAAAPWQAYRVQVTQSEGSSLTLQQLRLEIENPGDQGDPTRYQLVIGHRDEQGQFKASLIIRADNTVIIPGTLKMAAGSEIIEGPIQPDLGDPRFTSALLQSWAGGLSTAANQMQALYGRLIEVELIGLPESVQAGGSLSFTVQVTNNSPVELTNIELLLIPSVGGVKLADKVLASGFNLDPDGGANSIEVSYPIPSGSSGNVTLVITALAYAPDGTRPQHTVTSTIPIV